MSENKGFKRFLIITDKNCDGDVKFSDITNIVDFNEQFTICDEYELFDVYDKLTDNQYEGGDLCVFIGGCEEDDECCHEKYYICEEKLKEHIELKNMFCKKIADDEIIKCSCGNSECYMDEIMGSIGL